MRIDTRHPPESVTSPLTLPVVVQGTTHGPSLSTNAVTVKRGQHLVPTCAPPSWRQREEVSLARLVAAQRTSPRSVLSHESAALLHGAWLRNSEPDVHLTQETRPSRTRSPLPRVVYGGALAWGRSTGLPPAPDRGALDAGRQVHIIRHHGVVPEADVTTVKGMRVTGLVRTLVDCLLDLPAPDAFVIGDCLLRLGSQADRFHRDRGDQAASRLRQEAAEYLARRGRRHNSRRARQMLSLLSPWSESPGESEMRFVLLVAGTPEPVLQHPVDASNTTWFLDAAWPQAAIGLEFDGRGKYAASGSTLYREKRRQEELVVRVVSF